MKHVTVAAVCGEKGGIAKSTTASVLACSLAQDGKKVLCVDFCPSGALSSILRADNTDALNIMDVLTESCTVQEAVQSVCIAEKSSAGVAHEVRLDVLSSNSTLSHLDSYVKVTKDTLLYALKPIMDNYDYVVIDTSPQPKTSATVAVLTAADKIIIPTLAEPEPTKKIAKMVNTVLRVKGKEAVSNIGVLVTRHFPWINIYKSHYATIEAYCEKVGIRLFGHITNSCVVPESQDKAIALPFYQPARKSHAASDYATFTEKFQGWEVK